jgi:Protein of unknown function (DUF2442)
VIKLLTIQQPALWTLELEFSDHTHGFLDGRVYLDSHKGPLLDPLREANFVARAFVDGGALCWPNGLELSPQRLRALVSHAVDSK